MTSPGITAAPVSELDDRVMLSHLETLCACVSEFAHRYRVARAELDGARVELAQYRGDFESMSERAAALAAQVSTLEVQVSTLKAQVSSLEAQVSSRA